LGLHSARGASRLRAIDLEFPNSSLPKTDLRELIGHSVSISADCPLESVHKAFHAHGHDFMAVIAGERAVGICSRHEIGMRLGARYGFSLFSRKPVSEFLVGAPLFVRIGQDIGDVLETVFSRRDESFNQDVALLDADGRFLGLIYVHTLVRLQTQFLNDNIRLLQEHERVIGEKNRQMEEDLAMAREVQIAMLPERKMSFPPAASGGSAMHFARLYRPAQKVGGDFVHVIPLSNQATGIFIADVMGHGVRSALVTGMLRALVGEIGSTGAEPGRLLTETNRALTAILRPSGDMMFATAFYLIADFGAGTMKFARAGHPCPIWLRRSRGTAEHLVCERPLAGPGLCLVEDAKYGTAETPLDGDDAIVLFTDGVIEAGNPEGRMFGSDRLLGTVRHHAGLDIPDLVDAIFHEVEGFANSEPLEDDVCIVGLGATPPSLDASRRRQFEHWPEHSTGNSRTDAIRG